MTRRQFLHASSGLALAAVAGCSTDDPVPNSGASPSAASASPAPTSASPTPRASRTPTATPTPTGAPKPELTGTVADDFDVPWGLIFLSNGDALVSERNSARIIRVSAKGRKTTLGEVAGVVPPTGIGEGGLLGIASAPEDEETLFVYYTTDSDNRVARVSLAGGRVGKPKAVLTDIPTSTHHHGGRLLFDADGMLLVATGDAEQSSSAQDKDSLAGKILRIRPDGRAAAGNPFDNRTWSYGHRNVEGLAFDADGRLWATEFGDKEADELNLISKGRNYGWPDVEGRSDDDDLTNPKASWSPTSSCSPAGLAVTRSTAFVGALQGRCLFAVPLNGTKAGKPKAYFAEDHGRIRNAVVAPDGSLWMTTSNTDGRIDPGRNDDKILRVTL
ncbi:MAG TPA: PQQ-dependent sugar dehydrogenase [Microlunatus sp.]|nr:PQQ-dependent sugar dehydrogenase [Microlunatus sp.]